MKGEFIMKIDSMMKSFFESYDSDAIGSIDKISLNIGYKHNNISTTGYNFKESFNSFDSYIVGYSQYIKESLEAGSEVKDISILKEAFEKFMDSEILVENTINVTDIPNSIEDYLEGAKNIVPAYNEALSNITESGVSPEYSEFLYEMGESFANKLETVFNPYMENALRISGYSTNKSLFGNDKKEKVETTVFL
jgi:hypothetical protein